MLGRIQLKQILGTTQQSRLVRKGFASEAVATVEWSEARPYNEIPKVSLLYFMRHLLPGGRYHKKDFPNIMFDLRRQHGALYRLPGILGKSEVLISNDPTDFERVFRAEGIWPERPGGDILQHYRNELRKEIYQGVEGLTASQGEAWGFFRSSVNPVLMQPKTVGLYYRRTSQVNKEFIQRIRDIRNGSSLEVPDTFEEEICRWALESIALVALNKQLGLIISNRNDPQAVRLFESVTEFFTLLPEIEMKPSLWRYVATPTYKKIIRTLDVLQEVTMGYIEEAMKQLEREPNDKPDDEKGVLEKLLKVDKRIAIVMAMDMLMVGVDTTSGAFVGLLLCLAKNPLKQAQLREEVMQILPHKDSELTESSMKNAPYLRACIREALRIYPLVVANIRVIKSDTVLHGYRVPKESTVLLLLNGLLTDNQYYPRGSEFLPERWLRQSSESECEHGLKASSPFTYLPFGFGPRMCVGKRIVLMELEVGIARLIRNFYVEFNHPTENAFKTLLINVPNIPLKFKFIDVEK